MSFNINDMRSQLTFGGAKASHFQVQIQNPVNGIADIKVPFMVQAAQIPESTLGTIEVPYFGRKIKLAGDRTFAEWTVTVLNDEDFLIRNAMEQWMNAINSHEDNLTEFSSASPIQYKTQAQITQFSKTGVNLRTYNFNGLFPTNISNIQMDWGTTDDLERFDVTFQYDWWNISGGVTGDAGTS
ncbi:MAG: hypothetical protein COA84_13230 [Robiginitomaculum sp.]|nr:MAG: hypothetical protein COA84_13230 [Robiginitomaculum sp.]